MTTLSPPGRCTRSGSSSRKQLLGNPTKARERLGWKPDVTFEQLVEIMVRADWESISDS